MTKHSMRGAKKLITMCFRWQFQSAKSHDEKRELVLWHFRQISLLWIRSVGDDA